MFKEPVPHIIPNSLQTDLTTSKNPERLQSLDIDIPKPLSSNISLSSVGKICTENRFRVKIVKDEYVQLLLTSVMCWKVGTNDVDISANMFFPRSRIMDNARDKASCTYYRFAFARFVLFSVKTYV